MASVPRAVAPTQRLNALPADRQSIETPAAAFSSATTKAAGDVGTGLTQVGEKADALAVKIQDQDNADKVMSADAQLGNAYGEYQLGAAKRKGSAAKGLHDETDAWFKDTIGKISATLTPAQQRVFAQRAQQQQLAGKEYFGRYEMQERDRAALESAEASTTTTINTVAVDPTPQNVAVGIKKIQQNWAAIGMTSGMDKEVVAAKQAEDIAKMHSQVLQGMVENDPGRAAQYYAEHKAELGTAAAEAEKLVTIGVAKADARDIANRVLSGQISEQAALGEIRAKHGNSDVEDIYVSAIRGAGNEIESNIAKAQRDSRKAGLNYIAGGGTVANMPATMRSNLDAYDLANLQTYEDRLAKGQQPKTDYTIYDKLQGQYNADPSAFKNVDVTPFRNQLDDSAFEHFEALKTASANNAFEADQGTRNQQLSSAVEQLGLAGDLNAQGRGVFTAGVNQALDQATKAKGSALNYDERQKIIDRVKLETATTAAPKSKPLSDEIPIDKQLSAAHDKLGLSGANNAEARGAFDDGLYQALQTEQKRTGHELSQAERQSIITRWTAPVTVPGHIYDSHTPLYQLEVPDDDRQQIEQALQANGIPATELSVRELYAKKLAKQK